MGASRQDPRRPPRPAPSGASGRLAGVEANALFVRWQQQRDRAARDELVARFLPLAAKLARRYLGREPLDDLMQVACIGLLRAIERFDCSRGIAFSSFAVPTILGELKRHFRDTGWSVHVPRGMQELALKVQEAEQRLSAQTGRSPTIPDLAVYLEVSLEDVVDALQAAAAHHSSSLDAELSDRDGEGAALADAFGEEDKRFALIDDAVTIATAARDLSDRERRVLHLYFLEDRTQAEIAKQIGISQMQVSRILRRALDRLGRLSEGGAEAGAAG